MLFDPRPVFAQGVRPPTLVEEVDATWPGEARPDDLTVPVIVTITKEGSVSAVEVTASAGADLDQAVVAAARRWRFEPARRGDEPVAARVRALVRFPGKPPAPPPAAPTHWPARAPGTGVSPAAPSTTAPREATVPDSATPVGAATSTPAAEAAASTTPTAPPEAEASPEEVVVTGRAHAPLRGASDYVLPIRELSRVPRKNASELLELAPGIFLTNEGGEGHAERVYLRGFDAREGQDVELSLDGVPVNESGNLHGNGFADLHFIIPELVHTLRVLEGPFDPHQGNYAVAGSADYQLGLEQRGLTLKYGRGSFGAERLLVTFGPPGASVHTLAGAELYRTGGFGQNRSARRASSMAEYEGTLGRSTSFRLAGTGYATSYHEAGLLRADDVASGREGFFDTYDPHQGGNATRFQAMADLESRAGNFVLYQQLFAIRRTMRLRENFTGFLLDTQEAIQEPHGQRGDLFDLAVGETTYGLRGHARSQIDAFGRPQELELGYFARGDHVDGTRQRIDAASNHPYETDTDLHSELADIGLYADVALRPFEKVTLRGGARSDLFSYDVLDACAVQGVSLPDPDHPPGDASCLDQERGGEHREPTQRSSTAATKLMPRAAAQIGPFSHFTLSLAWGQGVRSIDPSYVTDDVQTPFASIEAEEGGVSFAKSFETLAMTARSVFFRTHVDRDLIFSETEGRTILGGGTTRLGWTGALRLTAPFIDENANVTLVRSAFDDNGLLVPYVPDAVVRSDTALTADLPVSVDGTPPRGSLAAGVSYIGRRALPYGQRSQTIFTVDGSAAVRFRAFELTLEITNVFDTRYRLAEYDYVSDFHSSDAPTLVPARHFAAGSPRTAMLSLSATLGDTP